jgi:hypothetical protein
MIGNHVMVEPDGARDMSGCIFCVRIPFLSGKIKRRVDDPQVRGTKLGLKPF